MSFILNEVEISSVQIYHWYLISVEISENSEKTYIDQVFNYYSTRCKFTPTRIRFLEEEIKSKGYPNSSEVKIIAISNLGDMTKEKFI